MRGLLAFCLGFSLFLPACGARSSIAERDAATLPPPDPDADGGVDPGHCDEPDADFDGHASIACGGDDCNDLDPTIHPGAVEDLAWRSAEIEQGLAAQYAASLVLAPTGELHAVYLSSKNAIRARHVRHAWLPAGAAAWETEQLIREGDGMEGDHGEPSVAIGPSGTLHVSYVRRPQSADGNILSSELTVAVPGDGSSWRTTVIDRREDSAVMTPRIAVDSAGTAHVSYWFGEPDAAGADNGEVRYATNATGRWVVEEVASRGWLGASGSLAVDAAGAAHLCVYSDVGEGATASYVTNAGGDWVVESLARVAPDGAALGLDLDGEPWIVLSLADGGTALAERNGPNEWTFNDVSVDGQVHGVAAVQGGDPGREFLFTEYSGDADPIPLRYAVHDGVRWAVEAVADVPRVTRHASAVRDATDQLHAVYLASEAASWIGAEGETHVRYARREAVDDVDRDCNGRP